MRYLHCHHFLKNVHFLRDTPSSGDVITFILTLTMRLHMYYNAHFISGNILMNNQSGKHTHLIPPAHVCNRVLAGKLLITVMLT